jgi:hypothetical protein
MTVSYLDDPCHHPPTTGAAQPIPAACCVIALFALLLLAGFLVMAVAYFRMSKFRDDAAVADDLPVGRDLPDGVRTQPVR